MRSTTILFLVPLLVLASTAAECREIRKDFHESFDAETGVVLRISHGDGDVVIQPWDRDVVDVTVSYRAEYKSIGFGDKHEFDVEFRQRGNTIHVIGKERSPDFIGLNFLSVREYTYTVRAPRYVELDLHGDDGDVSIEGWSGAIECKLDDGDIELNNVQSPKTRIWIADGDVTVENHIGELFVVGEDGDITVSESKTPLCRVDLEDGDVRIKRSEGDFEIESEDGDIRMYDVLSRRMEITTEDGDVIADLLKSEEPDIEIKTDDGDVTCTVAPGLSAKFTVDVDDATIKIDCPSADTIQKKEHSVTGELYGGRGRIRIVTQDGRVVLKES